MQAVQQSSINPAFARHHSDKLREVTDELHRVYDNLLEIARGDTPNSTGYDRLRATRVLYDRGYGKATKSQPRTPSPESGRSSESEESNNQTNHSSDTPSEGGEPALSAAQPSRPGSPASSRNSTTNSDFPRPPQSRSAWRMPRARRKEACPPQVPTPPATSPTSSGSPNTT